MAFARVFTDRYRRVEKRFLCRHPQLRRQYEKTLLLEATPFHPTPRLHPLKGRLSELHSVSINLLYRITITLLPSLCCHHSLYGGRCGPSR
jgi:hypothetical protein